MNLHAIIWQKGALDREVPALMTDLLGWLHSPGRAWPAVVSSAILHLTPKQEKLMTRLGKNHMGIQDIARTLRVTKPGAHHILKPLLAAGLVKREGGHKTGRYRAVSR